MASVYSWRSTAGVQAYPSHKFCASKMERRETNFLFELEE